MEETEQGKNGERTGDGSVFCFPDETDMDGGMADGYNASQAISAAMVRGGDTLKYLILLSTAYAMFRMVHWTLGFSYFTQLSNLLVAGVVLWQLISPSEKAFRAKLAATVSIFVTFLVYLLVLAPVMPGGILAAYRQDHWASLCMHLVTPALTVCDFLLVDCRKGTCVRHKRDALYAAIPPLAYFLLILFLRALGVDWAGMVAPYMFLNYAAPAGWFGFRPETVGPRSAGIGVFYVLLIMLGLFLLLGEMLSRLAARISARISGGIRP